ncbi:hypothetical protein [Micromonospora wenchangensis]|uniref:hypothetical protein n=1 Tax=Micromonospora wenchangensis TaxID=1185415 RepID=UPI003811E4AF
MTCRPGWSSRREGCQSKPGLSSLSALSSWWSERIRVSPRPTRVCTICCTELAGAVVGDRSG